MNRVAIVFRTKFENIPFSDYFWVATTFLFEKCQENGSAGLKIRIFVSVQFSKSTIIASKITSSSMEELRVSFVVFA